MPPRPPDRRPTAPGELIFPTDPLPYPWDGLSGCVFRTSSRSTTQTIHRRRPYTTKNTSFVVHEPLTVGQTFYWHVRGVSGSIFSDWSPTRSFHSIWPTTPTLVYPPPNATDITDVYFDWDPVLGAETYQLQVSPNGDWANNKTINVTVKSTRYEPPAPQQRQLLLACPGDRRRGSREQRAMVRQRGRERRRAGVPAGSGRRSHARRSRRHGHPHVPTWTWTPATHSSWYRLRISDNPQISDEIGNAWGCSRTGPRGRRICPALAPASEVPGSCTTPTLIAGHTYYWDVAGLDNPVLNPSAVDLWGPPAQVDRSQACGRTCTRSSGSRMPRSWARSGRLIPMTTSRPHPAIPPTIAPQRRRTRPSSAGRRSRAPRVHHDRRARSQLHEHLSHLYDAVQPPRSA